MKPSFFAGLILACTLTLAACSDGRRSGPPPAAQDITADAVGHYCGMNLIEHAGPKGQIFLEGSAEPIWFTAVKQVFAYTLLPEESKAIAAIYVNDMSKTGNWEQPDAGAWIDARQAWYVIESHYIGGMGVEDALPFGDRDQAQAFAQAHRGRVAAFQDVPESYIWRQGADITPAAGITENH